MASLETLSPLVGQALPYETWYFIHCSRIRCAQTVGHSMEGDRSLLDARYDGRPLTLFSRVLSVVLN